MWLYIIAMGTMAMYSMCGLHKRPFTDRSYSTTRHLVQTSLNTKILHLKYFRHEIFAIHINLCLMYIVIKLITRMEGGRQEQERQMEREGAEVNELVTYSAGSFVSLNAKTP